MPQMLPDFIDNTDRRNLADALNRIIADWNQRRLDVATGFFDPKVWRLLQENFPRLEQFRLLLGKAPELESQGDDRVDLRRFYRRQLQGEIEAMPFDPSYAALVDSLLAFLRRESVDVRLYPSFLHAKAYIFPAVAIAGSSNFTMAGLTRKAELNLVNKSDTIARSLQQEWFETFWADAEPYKEVLVQELENSKFGATRYGPFDVFIKALYEYFKERLVVESPENYIGVNLASFQQEGLRDAIRLLDRHHGAIIADAVGLGKTYIGMGLVEHYLLRKRRRGYIPRGLIVCPAQLRDLVWIPKLNEYGLKADIVSMEEMGRADFDWKAYNRYDLVLVDESHNFRNPATGRYQNLNKLITTGKSDKYVILLTATPINNTIWDLYHQVMLLARGRESYYREYGVTNLRGFFKRVVDGAAELFDLLEQSAVRRSRHDIKKRQEAGEIITIEGKGEIRFPERRLRALTYNLEQTYKGLYQEIADQIENLNLVSYNVEQFKKGRDEQTVERNNALIGIMKINFLKRLESSLRAFEVSVDRQRRFQQRFFDFLQEGRLLDSSNHRKLLALEAEEEVDAEAFEALIEALPEAETAEYDLDAIRKSLEADLRIFKDLLDWIAIVREEAGGVAGRDAKLAAVKEELAGPLKGRKVLIFNYYHDTAQYLYESLRDDDAWQEQAGRPVLGLITGSTPPAKRGEIVKRFAPLANTPDTDEGLRERERLRTEELQILISTDVLSEGQNLQDAGVLINYDLHWNPVRMIQRAGRIDRLGTTFDTLTIYNCFPEEGLEALLRLVERLRKRIGDIDRTVGLDASVLGEVIYPRSLEELRRIKAGDRAVLDELEQAAELLSTDEMKLPLVLYLQSIGEQRVQEIPLGIHSGKRGPVAGTFFAFKARDRHFWRFYPADGGEPVTDKRRLFHWISCTPAEPRHVPDHTIYPLLERATQEIVAELKALRPTSKIRPPMTGWNREFYRALNQPTLFEQVPDELRTRVSQVLLSFPLRGFQRDPALKAIRAAYKENGSIVALAEQLDAFFVENEMYREVVEPTVLEQIQAEDLQLVCYEILSTEE